MSKKGAVIKKNSSCVPLCFRIQTSLRKLSNSSRARGISSLIDGSLAFVDNDKCHIRCPFEEDLFLIPKELDRKIQLKWNLSGPQSLQIEYRDADSLHISDMPDNLQITQFPHKTRRRTIHSVCPPFHSIYKSRLMAGGHPQKFKHQSL